MIEGLTARDLNAVILQILSGEIFTATDGVNTLGVTVHQRFAHQKPEAVVG